MEIDMASSDKLAILAIVFGTALGCVCVGCGDGDSEPGSGTPNDPPNEVFLGCPQDPDPKQVGSIFYEQLEDRRSVSASATFGWIDKESKSDPECEFIREGPCTYSKCSYGDDGVYGYPGAGTITAYGNRGSFSMEFGEYFALVDGLLWDDGDIITIAGSGGGSVDAFTTEVTGMAAPLITSPEMPLVKDDPLKVAAGADFTLDWSRQRRGTVFVSFEVKQYSFQGKILMECNFDASTGTATIPGTLMNAFKAGDKAELRIKGLDGACVEGGDWPITVRLSVLAIKSNERSLVEKVEFE